ncbi:MAG TPA: tetratricopeptide repeat protein [Polyangiales bacterium]
MSAGEFLQGQLERLFELEGMMALSSELLGVEPAEVGGTGAKGTFARALVRHCESHDGLLVLAEAIRLSAGEQEEPLELVARPQEELTAGTEVRSFRILKTLETGPLWTMYLAERPAPSNGHTERAQLKVFQRALTRDRVVAWRMLTAARALKDVRDTGLVGIYDAGTLPDGRVYVAQEAVRGQKLSARMAAGPMPMHEVRALARTLLRGLSALHERDLLHGCLSAEHVLLVKPEGGRGPAYGVLGELATARLLENNDDAPVPFVLRLVGDPSALAPEVARGGAATPASEVYAVGCLLYRALTGVPPFEADTAIDQVLAHLYQPPESPSERAPNGWLPPEVDEVLLKALRKDPAARYQSAREFADALEELARTSVPPASTLSQVELVRAIGALHDDPANENLAGELEALVAPAGAWREALEAFHDAAEQSEDVAVKKQLSFRCARILLEELAERDEAERVYREVLELDPTDAQALNGLEELYRESGDHEQLINQLLDRLANEVDGEERAKVLREVASLYEEQLSQPENALVAWGQALAEGPQDERAKKAVERLASGDEQYEELIGVLTDALVGAEERPAQATLLNVICAEWYAHKLKRPEAALPLLHEALRLDPAHDGALDALARIYREAGAWSELVPHLLARADACANPSKAREFKAEAAALAHRELQDIELAEATFAAVLAEDPTHPAAVAALEEIYVEQGKLDKLIELLEAKAEELRGTQRAQALSELAELHEGDDAGDERAIALFQDALAADAEYLGAYRGLAKLYARRGEHQQLLQTLERERALATTPQQHIDLHLSLGALYEEQLADLPNAVDQYEQVIELSPAHEAANTALARLYRGLHRFEELAQTFDRHAKGVDDKVRKVELLMHAARVLMADLGSPDRAAFMCERILAVEPAHPEALALTARIRAHAGDNVAALDAIELLADSEQDGTRKADLWTRAALLLESNEDLDGAIERYKLALDVQPEHAGAIAALGRLYDRRGDLRGQADLLRRQAELASDPVEQAAKLTALGTLRLEKLKDKPAAEAAYKKALTIDPEQRAAMVGLGKLALADKRWEDAVQRLEPLLAHGEELPRDLARSLLTGLGDAYRELGEVDRAELAYGGARKMFPEDRALAERLADLAEARGDHARAAELFGALLDDGGSDLSTETRSALLLKLGRAHEALDQLVHATSAYAAASELLPSAREPLSALGRTQEKQGNWDGLARALERELDLEQDDTKRFRLLVRAGDVALKLEDPELAARRYVSALEINADDRNLLSKLMSLYSSGKDWSKLVEVLVRMARVVDDPLLCGKYLYTAAGIAHTELGELEEAIDYYENALGFDSTLEPAFRGLVQCLSEAGAWDRLASAYRAQLERQKDELDDEARATLWDTLGSIYLDRLHRIDPAIDAYETASALMPENRARTELLVELYSRSPSRFADRAIAAHERLLTANPYRVESYRALRKLYTQLQRPDEAWLVCQALRSLSMAEPEEEQFFKRHRVQAPATARECITEELWQELVLLPEQDQALTSMLALIQPAAVAETAQEPELFGIEREPLDCEHSEVILAQMLHYASGVTLVPLPSVFLRPQDPGGLSFLFLRPPALGLGQGALRGAPDQALAFLAGRQLSFFRPGHYMRQLVPTGSGLRAWLLAAIRVANPRFPVPDAQRELVERNVAALMRTLYPPQLQTLTSMVEQLLREQPELDMKRWAWAVDLAADRVGFVLANSLDAAVAVVRASPEESSYANERDRLKALYQYAVSPKYAALRKAIGVTIG